MTWSTACPISSSSAGAEDELYWARDGVQDSQLCKLKAGQVPFEGSPTCARHERGEGPRDALDFFAGKPRATKCAACA